MPKYVAQFSYTGDAWGRMIQNPADRAGAFRQVVESLGGRLECFYWMFGDYDGLTIFEAPDAVTAGAVVAAVLGSGAVRTSTHELLTMEDAVALLNKAKSATSAYRRPGA
jgi:uncharacterized protein with GYD domain